MSYLRVWQELDLNEIKNHLLVAGALTGDCFSCKAIGLNFNQIKACPNCQVEFKYIGLRGQANAATIKRLKEKRPDLIFIDFQDFKYALDSQKAKELLK